VASSGTAVPLADHSIAIRAVWVTAMTPNTNPVAIGGSDVVGSAAGRKGIVLRPGDPSVKLCAEDGVDELSDVYVDAQTGTEGVTWAYSPA
jgi:hypothetical protein